MGITLGKIARNTATVEVQVGEDTVHVVYRPGLVTEKVISDLQAFSTTDEHTIAANFAALNGIMTRLIVSWDVFEDDEQTRMFPLETHRLAELPIAFRSQVLQAMLSDIRPNQIAPQAQQNGNSLH